MAIWWCGVCEVTWECPAVCIFSHFCTISINSTLLSMTRTTFWKSESYFILSWPGITEIWCCPHIIYAALTVWFFSASRVRPTVTCRLDVSSPLSFLSAKIPPITGLCFCHTSRYVRLTANEWTWKVMLIAFSCWWRVLIFWWYGGKQKLV